ncbi:MAG: hypothetical protein ACREFB_06050, partial [Stellaceae bacterium]
MPSDPTSYDAPDPGRRRFRPGGRYWLPVAITLFGTLVVALICAAVYMQLAEQRTSIIEEARKHTSNLARAFEEHIRRTVKEVDDTLLVLKHGYESDPAHFKLWEWPGRELLLPDLSVQIMMADKNGIIVGTTDGPAPVTASVRNEDYFQAQIHNTADTLFIGKPILGGGA